MVTELDDAPEPDLAQAIAWLGPCDLVIVEGYKTAPIPKIEVRRSAALGSELLAGKDPNVIAVAADHAADGCGRPVFSLDDTVGIADFIAALSACPRPCRRQPTHPCSREMRLRGILPYVLAATALGTSPWRRRRSPRATWS